MANDQSMEDELNVELHDLVSNSEIGDDLHMRPPASKQNIHFITEVTEDDGQ